MGKPAKIIAVVGVRPQFIKHAPVSKELRKVFREVLVHTGQHYDYEMSKSFFDELDIPEPDFNLEIGSGLPCWQIGSIMIELEKIILSEKPVLMIVYGDTNSTAAAAVAAAKNNIPLAHIEAGLREFNKAIPEEVNKLLTDSVTDYYFSPTETGVENLKKAGITENVYNVGDVGIDVVFNALDRIERNVQVLKRFNLRRKEYYFVTCHRASNIDKVSNLIEILSTFKEIEGDIIFPIHPRTRKAIKENKLDDMVDLDNLKIVPPLEFFDTQVLIRCAKMVLTDSGGVIKEAYFHKTPGIIIDTQTEWIETVNEGWNYIAGPNRDKILEKVKNFKIPSVHSNCLGDGRASEKIKNILRGNFS